MIGFLFQLIYVCSHPGCGAKSNKKWNHLQHMKRHLGIYQYQCPYCNKGLSATRDIKRHLKNMHTGLFGFHCVTCRQEFETIHLLKAHVEKLDCQNVATTENVLNPEFVADPEINVINPENVNN